MEPTLVFMALCAGFEKLPDMCAEYFDTSSDGSSIKGGYIVAIVFVLVFLNVVIVYCYRRYAKREMQTEMKMQIESAVG